MESVTPESEVDVEPVFRSISQPILSNGLVSECNLSPSEIRRRKAGQIVEIKKKACRRRKNKASRKARRKSRN